MCSLLSIFNCMKFHLVLWMALTSQVCIAQWPEFNRVHPVSCQWPAFNYLAHGFFENVFVIDTLPNYYDGYLALGRGILCNPDSCIKYTRNFSAKCNENGELMWWNRYDNPELDMGEAWFNGFPANLGGAIKNHNAQIVSTFTTKQETGEFDTFKDYLVFLNLNGEIIHQHMIDSSFAVYAFNGIIEDTTDSTYVAYGWYQDSLQVINNTEPDAFLIKLDSLGNHIWQKMYNNTFAVWPGGVVKAMDGGFWICSYYNTGLECSDNFTFNDDLVLIKTDEYGIEEDRIIIGGNCGYEIATVYEYEEDMIVLAGRLTPVEFGETLYEGYIYTALVEQLSNGQLASLNEIHTYLHTPGIGIFTDLHHLSDGTFIIVGDNFIAATEDGVYSKSGYLLKLDGNRDSLWCRSYRCYDEPLTGLQQQDAECFLLDSKPTLDGGFICSGWIQQWMDNPNPGLQTPWLFKVDSLGCLEPGCQDVGVSEIVIGLQNTMSLYPNPTNTTANIAFSFPSNYAPPKKSELVVVDMQGKEVMRQNLTVFGLSNATIDIDVSKLASGMFTVHWVSEHAWLDSLKLVKE